MSASVVIYVGDAPYGQPVTAPAPKSSRELGGVLAGNDPHAIAKEFPERWMAYIRATNSSPLQVQMRFQVSERTAYRWWKGQGGAKGSHVAMAVRAHPVEAPAMLFAEAA